MRISRLTLPILLLLMLALALAACSEEQPQANPNPNPQQPQATDVPAGTDVSATEVIPSDSDTPVPTRPAQEAYCKNGGAVAVGPNDKLAAKVNGQGIPLALYQREAEQGRLALVAQGIDFNSDQGKEALKALNEQALGQLIDNVIVEQAAKQENVAVRDQDVNDRIQQMIDDAGGRDQFNQYLKETQMSMDDLCVQLRASAFGEVMLERVTAAIPTKVEQVHVAQILVNSQADGDKVLAQLKAGKKFADLAKEFSQDTETKDNGGDLGWLPKGMMPPEFEAAAFQLPAGQTSGVIKTALGFHIIQVIAHEQARELEPDMLQNQKQQAFLAWLDAKRNQAKIEKLINP